MIEFRAPDAPPIEPPERDGVKGLEGEPLVVSISDLHGYLGATRSALKTVGDHEDYDPLVESDDEGQLHWAGGDEYVLVLNGDLIDRGPDSEGVIALVGRLSREAPHGHVRVTLGNHEWGVLFPALVHWEEWYSSQRTDDDRRGLCEAVANGDIVACYEGYNFTYAHAGQPTRYEAGPINDELVAAAEQLAPAIGTEDDDAVQRDVIDEYWRVLSMGEQGGRGFGAGIVWLDFRYLPGASLPQVVGHTRQEQPVQKGNVVCENVIRSNQTNPGGEAVLVESPDSLRSLERTFDGEVHTNDFQVPETAHADD